MNEMEIYTVNDLMVAAAKALQKRNAEGIEILEALVYVVRDWMQPREETEAQIEMLNSMLEALYDLEAENEDLI